MFRNWYIGKRVSEEELNGADRADYGKKIIDDLAKKLTMKYGKGYTKRAIYQYLSFYRMFPQIVYEPRTQ